MSENIPIDELAAKRFKKRQGGDDMPTVSEVLNTALQTAKDEPGFTQVIVLLHDPETFRIVGVNNISNEITSVGLLDLAKRGHRGG